MASVGTKDTGPEVRVRRLIHRMGYRFRLHDRRLPGRPDLAFAGRKQVIFVHGCFWHGHGCAKGRLPKSRLRYWAPKIEANRRRDGRNVRELRAAGWRAMVVWQCELKKEAQLVRRLVRFLDAAAAEGQKKKRRR